MNDLYNLSCKDCRLYEGRNRVVPASFQGLSVSTDTFDTPEELNLTSNLMIVGEAPGREEDIDGKPFVGGSGRILSSLLHNVKLKRSEIYTTNIVKCRPPNNRTPEADEVLACNKYLINEVERVKPKLIIALGETAGITLTGKPISWRGLVVSSLSIYNNIPTLITYHPSYLMRNQDEYPVAAWDLEKVHLFLKEGIKEYPELYLTNPLDLSLLSEWKDNPTAVDIETVGNKEDDDSGLNPFKDTIVGISLSGEPGKAIHFNGSYLEKCWPLLKEFLETHAKLIYHNNIFDRTFLKVRQSISSTCMYDTLTGMHLINSSLPKKLNFLRSLYTNRPPYKTKAHYKEDLALVNNRDVDTTLQIFNTQKLHLTTKQAKLMEKGMQADNIAIKMRIRGIKIALNTLASHYAFVQPTIGKIEKEFMQKYNCSISSPKQLSHLLYKELRFDPPFKAIRSKSISTDDKTINYLLSKCIGNPPEKVALLSIQEYRDIQKIASTYCEGIYKRIQEDGKLHPDWRPTGTDTGRWACKNPNLQNQPKKMRDMYIPTDDNIFLGADYNKIELLLAGILSEDYSLVETILKGTDLWSILLDEVEKTFPATKTYGVIRVKTHIKTIVYGTINGRSVKDIASTFQTPVGIVQEWLNIFYSVFPKLKKFFEITIPDIWKKQGYVEIFTGRRKYAKKETEARSMYIQGSAAEVMTNALIKLDEANFNLILTIHDQLVCEEKDSSRLEEFKTIMRTSTPELSSIFPLEGTTGKTWLELENKI